MEENTLDYTTFWFWFWNFKPKHHCWSERRVPVGSEQVFPKHQHVEVKKWFGWQNTRDVTYKGHKEKKTTNCLFPLGEIVQQCKLYANVWSTMKKNKLLWRLIINRNCYYGLRNLVFKIRVVVFVFFGLFVATSIEMMSCSTFNPDYCPPLLKLDTLVDLMLCDENKSVHSNSRFL